MAGLSVIADASADPDFADMLNTALLRDLRAAAPQGVNSRIDLATRGPDGALLAGLSAVTSYGWVHINMVWVAQAHRGGGLGRALVLRACDIGRDRDCHSVWLDTSSAQARRFYQALGFDLFGVLENGGDAAPPDHSRWFLRLNLPPRSEV